MRHHAPVSRRLMSCFEDRDGDLGLLPASPTVLRHQDGAGVEHIAAAILPVDNVTVSHAIRFLGLTVAVVAGLWVRVAPLFFRITGLRFIRLRNSAR
jgi:hypothetical protein